jgi:hypothetical protein
MMVHAVHVPMCHLSFHFLCFCASSVTDYDHFSVFLMTMMQVQSSLFLISLFAAGNCHAFISPLTFGIQRLPSSSSSSPTTTMLRDGEGGIETVEFKIYADGRVEEVVQGVKGDGCLKITEKVNEALGKVISSAPTAEMHEQEVVVMQTLTESVGTDSGSTTSWEGSSSW